MLKKIGSIILAICLSSCSVIGVNNTPQAKYKTLEKKGDFRIREYPSLILAEITVDESDRKAAVNKGFRQLFKYITGENVSVEQISMTAPVITQDKPEKIQMTAPVMMKDDGKKWTIAFVLPEKYTLETAPKPLNKNIQIKEQQARKVAVIEFNGLISVEAINENTQKLKGWIVKNNLEITGEPIVAGYNPPWMIPYLRKNEIMIPIK